MNSSTLITIIIVVAVFIISGLVAWMVNRKNYSDKLRNKFGPEYDYAVEKEGDKRKAELLLQEREKRADELKIHTLDEILNQRYSTEWMDIQTKFVDDPKGAVELANRLITEVMIARGFPIADFEQRAADLSLFYPEFVPNYRSANAIALKNQNNGTSTEEHRQAMVHYHAMFDELLETERTIEVETSR